MSAARAPLRADQTALLFPTGGYHWPGMGNDIDASPKRVVFDEVESALTRIGVEVGSLRRLMAGADQARRARGPDGWTWAGDFPLSMAAQMALGVGLAESFIERYGPPRAVAGESMGELAATCVAGALPLDHAGLLTYRWARDLESASNALGLRMAVVEDLDESEWASCASAFEANVVVKEASRLFVVALPSRLLDSLDREVIAKGGHTLVSNNPCAAHEPRLAQVPGIWEEHAHFLDGLPFEIPKIALLSTLAPPALLADVAALRRNRADTTFVRVRWGETVAALPALGVRRLVQLGPPSSGYALKKLRALDSRLASVRIDVVPSLQALGALG